MPPPREMSAAEQTHSCQCRVARCFAVISYHHFTSRATRQTPRTSRVAYCVLASRLENGHMDGGTLVRDKYRRWRRRDERCCVARRSPLVAARDATDTRRSRSSRAASPLAQSWSLPARPRGAPELFRETRRVRHGAGLVRRRRGGKAMPELRRILRRTQAMPQVQEGVVL